VNHAACDQRRDALDSCEQDETDSLGLPLFDQLEHDREGAVASIL
jgi:hypothetical protein